MSLKKLLDLCVVAAGVYLIAIGLFDMHPEFPRWGWIVLGCVLLLSKGIQFYLAVLVRRRRESASGGTPRRR
ncbi:hypothetical protein MMAD_01270 [Mycolicibacterium madagascariense]|uniref:Uncharacterized protein n=1 Tax=Mycolicibacterium madagascariense TaxID=212765 RepID=A0A7I7X8S9_9MYCO|nr:hypothetical protein [Mycolicibacterium madagascariense]MCV7013449.1 hypothetical protein [Mycolicibacterium madagascariense]BBZ25832.1 hypothetical protein MMAD_01270 [Mycolicibacterium madagascariense]